MGVEYKSGWIQVFGKDSYHLCDIRCFCCVELDRFGRVAAPDGREVSVAFVENVDGKKNHTDEVKTNRDNLIYEKDTVLSEDILRDVET